MKTLLYLFLGLALFSCKDDSTENNPLGEEDKEMIELRNQVEQLKLDNRMKDSVLNESLAFFNEIQENLAKISVKQEQIRIRSTNPEISNDDKEWVLQEIQNINFLREENARKVRSLQKQAKNDALQISQLQATIDRLVLQIQSQDERIEALQNQLANLDMEYSELFDQYQEQVELALDVMKELNQVHYAYGTQEELIANKVLVKEGGFIGIGKKTTIADDMNQQYFQHLDKTKTKQITIIGEKPQIITDHPASSYEWQGNKLVIKDVNAFWRISNYLVVTVK
jgi:DNA repair exonuclease SbcCD ATPase subunit